MVTTIRMVKLLLWLLCWTSDSNNSSIVVHNSSIIVNLWFLCWTIVNYCFLGYGTMVMNPG
jgi:hypothetical protein